jgi:hypothetical protein
MEQSNEFPCCRQCPSGNFDLVYVKQSRYMAICHAKECILSPKFPDNEIRESQHISKANVRTVVFEPLDNCPHVESLRAKGLLPWATTVVDFSK